MFIKRGNIFTLMDSSRIKAASDWTDIVSRKTSTAEGIIVHRNLQPTNMNDAVCKIDVDNYIYIHTTVMASVDLEQGSDYWITKATEKYINTNGDAWPRDVLLKDYVTFVDSGIVYVEHDQSPEHAKGKVLDAVARDMGDTILIDLLFCVDKRHDDLVHNIETGLANAVSMGCTTKYTLCSICGNVAHDENDYCIHVKNYKNQLVKCSDGNYRKACEVCFENTFYDCSIVANPAFAGAVFRKLVASDKVSSQLLANILCRKINSMEYENELLKVASVSKQAMHPIEEREIKTYEIEDGHADIPYRDPHNISKIFDEQQAESVLEAGHGKKKKASKCSDFGSLVVLKDRFTVPSEDRSPKLLFNFIGKDTVGRLIGREAKSCAVYFSKFGMIRNIPSNLVMSFSIYKQAKVKDTDLVVNRKGIFADTDERFQILSICDGEVEIRWLNGDKVGQKEKLPKKRFSDKDVKWMQIQDLVTFDAWWDGQKYQVKKANWNEKYASTLNEFESHIDNVQHDITCTMPKLRGKYSKSFAVMTKFGNTTLKFDTSVKNNGLHINVQSATL